MLGNILQDLRYSVRALRKNPGFTLAAAVTLALGIGANTAIFSIVDALLFRPLPVSRPQELVRVFGGETKGSSQVGFISLPAYEFYRDQVNAFSGMAAYGDRFTADVSVAKSNMERVPAGMVTANYFKVLEVHADQGRTLLPDDDRPGSSPVVMLGYAFWKRHYTNLNALDSQVLVNGKWFTVVGIVPPHFGGVSFETFPDIWIPMTQAVAIDPLLKHQIPLRHESFTSFGAVARLKAGVSMQQAQLQLDVLAKRLGAGNRDTNEGPNWRRPWPTLVTVTDAARKGNASFSFLLLGIVALVLLTACTDMAGLLMSRSEMRQREIAIRLALGGSRQRIIRLYLSEAFVISGLGAGLGCLLAAWGTQLIVLTAPKTLSLPLTRTSSIFDLRILVFTAFVAILAALLSTFMPAMKYSRSSLLTVIKSDSMRPGIMSARFNGQTALVVTQIALSVVLLIGTGLLMRTLWHASRVNLGFNPKRTVLASTDLTALGFSKDKAASLLNPLLESLRTQPGVESAALGPAPLDGDMWTVATMETHDSSEGTMDGIGLSRVSPGYFVTVGIPLLKGRDFSRSDSTGAPGVAIISEAMAHKYWPNEDALGKHIKSLGGNQDKGFEIVGIVGNTAAYDLRRESNKGFYFPLDQTYLSFSLQPQTTLIARGSISSGQLIGGIRRAIAGIDASLPVFHARTLNDYVDGILGREKFLARLLLIFSVVATILAATGVFGLISYNTEQSKHDFGVRMALGATSQHILWMVLKGSLRIAAVGLTIGIGVSLWLTRLLVNMLFGVTPHDLFTFMCVTALTILAVMLSSYLPARKTIKIDPLEALRSE